jgi:hypothetical protein
MTVLDTLKVVIEGDASGAQQSFFRAAKALQKLENQIDAFDRALAGDRKAVEATVSAHQKLANAVEEGGKTRDKGAAGWAKEIAIFQRYRAALYLVGEGFRQVYQIAEDGARAGAAEQYFRNAGKSLQEFRTATKGLISDADLIKKANLADTMGLSGETFKTLANIAHASAAKTGQSFEHMLDSIILGTARESRLLLDNLGIIVNVTKAKQNYAKELKNGADAAKYSALSVDQLAASLTDAAEKTAFFEEVQRSGQGSLLEQATVGATAADNFDRFGASVDNLKTSIGKLIAEGSESALAKMATAIGGIADELERIGRVGMVREGGFVDIVRNAATGIYDAGRAGAAVDPFAVAGAGVGLAAAPMLLPFAGTAALAGLAGTDLAGGAGAIENDLMLQFDVLAEKAADAGIAFDEIPDLAKIVEDFPDDAVHQFGEELVWVIGEMKKTGDQLGINWAKKAGKPGADGGPVDPEKLKAAQEAAAEKAKKARKDAEEAARKHQELVLKYEKEFFDKEMELRKKAAEQSYELIRRLSQTPEMAHAARMARATEMGMGTGDYAQRAADEADRRAIADKKTADAVAGVEQAGGMFKAAMSGSAEALGTAIGGLFGPLGVAIGGLIGGLLEPLQPVIELLGDLASGIVGLLELGLNPFLRTLQPLGPALELLLRAVGVLIAGALRPLIPYMQGLVFVVAAAIDIIAYVLVFLAAVAELAVKLTSSFMLLFNVIWNIVAMFVGLGGGDIPDFMEAMKNATYWISVFTDGVINATVDMNNGIVRFLRGLGRSLGDLDVFDLSHFGDLISRSDLAPPDTEPIANNTDATDRNTQAVEQLSRDLRNLPSGYKVNYALYGATAPTRQYLAISDSVGAAWNSRFGGNPPNYRWRT